MDNGKSTQVIHNSDGSTRLATGLVAGKYAPPSIGHAGGHRITPDECQCSCGVFAGSGGGTGKPK